VVVTSATTGCLPCQVIVRIKAKRGEENSIKATPRGAVGITYSDINA